MNRREFLKGLGALALSFPLVKEKREWIESPETEYHACLDAKGRISIDEVHTFGDFKIDDFTFNPGMDLAIPSMVWAPTNYVYNDSRIQLAGPGCVEYHADKKIYTVRWNEKEVEGVWCNGVPTDNLEEEFHRRLSWICIPRALYVYWKPPVDCIEIGGWDKFTSGTYLYIMNLNDCYRELMMPEFWEWYREEYHFFFKSPWDVCWGLSEGEICDTLSL